MDENRYETGLRIRKAVLGEAHVEKALGQASEFTKPFQELITEFAWGANWGDGTLSLQQRSLMTLGMLAATGRMEEFALHFRAARRNGLTIEQLRAALIHISIYCGIPAGVECFRVAGRILEE
jgi:4-carboxymuconolactone decarboxylase